MCVNIRLVIMKCRRLGGGNEGRGRDGAGPVLKWLFDLQSRPGCSRLEHCGKALRWRWNARKKFCRLLAAGLVTHRHELMIRNVSAEEKVSGSGLWHSFSPS